MPRRVLLHLSQLPQDPASGAARSMRTICELLADAEGGGAFEVRAVGTTATEHADGRDAADILTEGGYEPKAREVQGLRRPVIRCEGRGVSYALLDAGRVRPWELPDEAQEDLHQLLLREILGWTPDVSILYGGSIPEQKRRWLLRQRGSAIVFGLRNHGYLKGERPFAGVDLVVTPSEYLSGLYRARLGVESVAIPTPIEPADAIADDHQPVFATMVNPAPEKGLMFFATLAEELTRARPELPMMVVESRGTAGLLVKAGLAGGFDLRRHRNIQVSAGVAQPKHIYAVTRTLLVPSLWAEPLGRVAAEAMLNGAPPIVSDRGGLPEAVAGGGIVEPIDPSVTPKAPRPVEPGLVRGWLDRTIALMEDDDLHASWSERAERASRRYLPGALQPRYVELVRGVTRGPDLTLGPGLD
jgi:glycosyltransferase involved in cell wall biosynthesis